VKRLAIVLAMLLSGCTPKRIAGTFVAPVGPYPVPRIGYKVLRGTSADTMEPIFTVQSTTFTDTTAQPGVKYFYAIVAVYADGNEAVPSNIACGTTSSGQVSCAP
jgi:hypothetical protein